MVASKSLARRLARLIRPSVRSATRRFGRTMKALIYLSLRWTTVIKMRLGSMHCDRPDLTNQWITGCLRPIKSKISRVRLHRRRLSDHKARKILCARHNKINLGFKTISHYIQADGLASSQGYCLLASAYNNVGGTPGFLKDNPSQLVSTETCLGAIACIKQPLG
jgi:hypothetical protein